MTVSTLKSAALALGGDVTGRNSIHCPGPGHSQSDRSLQVTFKPDGSFVCRSFSGDDWKACRDHVKERLGLSDDRPRPANDNRAPSPVAALLDERQESESALRLWAESVPISGTLADRYLASRRLAYSGDALRFHRGKVMMVALMTDAATGRPRGVHRTFLDADGRKVDRKMLGPSKGAVVRLSADEGVTHGLGIAEGIETALATGFAPIWACLSAGNMKAFPVLSGIEALTIFADNDASGTGQKAAHECGRRWHAAGREITIAEPTQTGADFADMREAA